MRFNHGFIAYKSDVTPVLDVVLWTSSRDVFYGRASFALPDGRVRNLEMADPPEFGPLSLIVALADGTTLSVRGVDSQ